MKIIIPISVGELLDKISILQIKSQHTDNPYVINELNDLIEIAKEKKVFNFEYFDKLLAVNQKLWKIEDKLREFEKSHIFNDEFINLARSVYITNDKRSRIKKQINESTNSELREIKIYNN